MRALNISAILLFITSLSCIAGEVGDAVRGKELSAYCIGCHGEYGVAPRPSTPNLAGQNKEYLEYALKAYRDGTRQGGLAVIMQANARTLSAQNISDLAIFFSSLPGKNSTKPLQKQD